LEAEVLLAQRGYFMFEENSGYAPYVIHIRPQGVPSTCGLSPLGDTLEARMASEKAQEEK
jgi:hypothetical protein